MSEPTPGKVHSCTDDCTSDCARCKGKPYYVKRSLDGRYWLVMWRVSDFPAASFHAGDFPTAKERAQVVANELNGKAGA